MANNFIGYVHRHTENFLPGGGGVNHLPKKFSQVTQIFYKRVEKKRGPYCNNIGRTGVWRWLDTVFQGQYQVRRDKQHCHSIEITPLPILLQQNLKNSRHWQPYRIIHRSFFRQYGLLDLCKLLRKICKSFIEILWDEVFTVRNTVRKGKFWGLAAICGKRSDFDMQFHLIVVLIFLKTCVKDRGDSSARLLERRIWLVCIAALLLAVL